MATRESLAGTPFFFVGRRPFRQARLVSYIRREHRRGRRLSEILDDRYVKRCGSREFVWQTIRDSALIQLLEQDVVEAIHGASEALTK